MTTQDPELSAALGWPGGISDPVLDRKTLLQMVAALRLASKQALEALEHATPTTDWSYMITALRAALAQQAEPVQDQDVEDAIEAAYWQFDCRKKGLNEWASAPQSERDAFKAEARKLVRGYFPTRQAQDTKREMLAVADAFIRGKRAALAQQAEPTLTIERLRDALVASRIIPLEAVEDPDEYDDGVTLHRIEALHRRIA